MNRITAFEIAVAVVGAMTFAGIAAIAPPAYADDNPYTPEPAASTETFDHGVGTYCRIGLTIPAWTCDQELSANGVGEGNKEGLPAREGKHIVHEVKTPPAPPSPPGQPGGPVGGDL